jgi:hypothetical protein
MNRLSTIALLALAAAAAGCGANAETVESSTPSNALAEPVSSHAPAPAGATSASPGASASSAAHHANPVSAPSSNTAVASIEADEREVTIPAGTRLSLRLNSTVSSRTSNVEDGVQATLRTPVVVDGVTVAPAGTAVSGYVTEARRSGRVKGRARVGVRFNSIRVDGTRYAMRTSGFAREAPGTKKEDATKIGIGAGAGAVAGAIAGGGKGAAIGSAVGGGAGTGVVLATRGREVSIGPGTPVTVRLAQPLTIRIR